MENFRVNIKLKYILVITWVLFFWAGLAWMSYEFENTEKIETSIFTDYTEDYTFIKYLRTNEQIEETSTLPYNISMKSYSLFQHSDPFLINNSCNPQKFSMNDQQLNFVFDQSKKDQSCNESFRPIITIENNLLSISCSDNRTAFYLLGTKPEQEYIGSPNTRYKFTEYESPVDMETTEFAYAKCGDAKPSAVLFNRYSQTISNHSMNTTEKITKMMNSSSIKPLTVLLIVFDSLSRQQFYQNFPNFITYMNDSLINEASNKYLVYDFPFHNALGENTIPNMLPLLYGFSLKKVKEDLSGFSYKNASYYEEFTKYQRYAIWKHYNKLGFVTMFGFETVEEYLNPYTGYKIISDHMASNFWHIAREYNGYYDFNPMERCIGEHYSHNFLLNYTSSFINNYKSHNKFSYIHLMEGHEYTGKAIKTVDKDLLRFINDTLSLYNELDEDLAIIITSDHGLHVGKWNYFEEGTKENLMPFAFFIMNKELVWKIGPETHRILQYNQRKLITKYDIRLTLKHLALMPYGVLLENSTLYSSWKTEISEANSVSLIAEKISPEKTCIDVNIPSYWCICNEYQEISITDESKIDLLQFLVDFTIEFINGNLNKIYIFCKKISFNSLLHAEMTESADFSSTMNFKIQFSINEEPNAIFQTEIYMAPPDVFVDTFKPNFESEVYPFSNYTYNNEFFIAQIQNIWRVDTIKSFSLVIAPLVELKSSLCIAQHPRDYPLVPKNSHTFYSKVYTELKRRFTTVIGFKNATCEDTCLDRSKVCIDWGIQVLNNLEILKENWEETPRFRIWASGKLRAFSQLDIQGEAEGKMLGIITKEKKNILIQGDWETLSCSQADEDTFPICACK
ncbi:unnamed protein product [Blepharisma stoltei]|uniref:Uncharacterized protein n=1 Tax=Blepharisma stoltei TaxID=1481888 RepID=A0AAU9K7K3_9CILI|nr:unnamed protein product [Blepharisma stoltei]